MSKHKLPAERRFLANGSSTEQIGKSSSHEAAEVKGVKIVLTKDEIVEITEAEYPEWHALAQQAMAEINAGLTEDWP